MNLKDRIEAARVDGRGVRFRRWTIMERLRAWALRKLDAVDRLSAANFAADYMQPNGRAVHTLAGPEARLVGEVVEIPPGLTGVAIAPWARPAVLKFNYFVDKAA